MPYPHFASEEAEDVTGQLEYRRGKWLSPGQIRIPLPLKLAGNELKNF